MDRSWEYINRSQTHECGNWDWGRVISKKGTHKWDFRYSLILLYTGSYMSAGTGTEAVQFPNKEYINRTFVTVWSYCVMYTAPLLWIRWQSQGMTSQRLWFNVYPNRSIKGWREWGGWWGEGSKHYWGLRGLFPKESLEHRRQRQHLRCCVGCPPFTYTVCKPSFYAPIRLKMISDTT